MLSVIKQNVVMLSVIMQNVVMLNVAAPSISSSPRQMFWDGQKHCQTQKGTCLSRCIDTNKSRIQELQQCGQYYKTFLE